MEAIAQLFGNWLSVLLAMPLVGAVVIGFLGKSESQIKRLALTFSILTFVVSLPLFANAVFLAASY